MPKVKSLKLSERRANRAAAAAAAAASASGSDDVTDLEHLTTNELMQMIQARADYTIDYASALRRMDKQELMRQVRAPFSMAAAAAASSEPVLPPGRSLCESDQVGTTRDLRKLAKDRGILNSSTLTKTQLCMALSAVDKEADAKGEDVEPLDGSVDLVTQEVMIDPVVASDGYSYDYASLRNLFVTAMHKFEDAGRPRGAARQPHVKSLHDANIRLENPFPDIPGGWPVTFPLIRNHDLRRAINEWRLIHGLAKVEVTEMSVAAASAATAPVVRSQRDQGGFANGIFYSAAEAASSSAVPAAVPAPAQAINYDTVSDGSDDSSDDSSDDEPVDPEAMRRAGHTLLDAQPSLTNHDLQTSLTAVRDIQIHVVGSHVSMARFRNVIRDLIILVVADGQAIRIVVSALDALAEQYAKADANWRFIGLVHLIRYACLFLRVHQRNARTISPLQVLHALHVVEKVSGASPIIGLAGSALFEALPRTASGHTTVEAFKRYMLHMIQSERLAQTLGETSDVFMARFSGEDYEELCQIENSEDARLILRHTTDLARRRGAHRTVNETCRALGIHTFQRACTILFEQELLLRNVRPRLQQPDSLVTARCRLEEFGGYLPVSVTHSMRVGDWTFMASRAFEFTPDACTYVQQHVWENFRTLFEAIAKAVAQATARRKHLISAANLQEAMERS
jgi:hypothetical protein